MGNRLNDFTAFEDMKVTVLAMVRLYCRGRHGSKNGLCSGSMVLAMGWAGLDGMLRRTLYPLGEFKLEMNLAMVGGMSITAGFFCLLSNLVRTLGFGTIVKLSLPARLIPEAKQMIP